MNSAASVSSTVSKSSGAIQRIAGCVAQAALGVEDPGQRIADAPDETGELARAGEALVHLELEAGVAGCRQLAAQHGRQAVAGAEIWVVSPHAQVRGDERLLPGAGEAGFERAPRIEEQADVGATDLAVEHRREAVDGDVQD